MRNRTLAGWVGLLIVAGCGTAEDVHPISWYVAHETELQSKVSWCQDDARRQQTPDCMNAIEAKRRVALGSQKNLAPIDWGASQAKP